MEKSDQYCHDKNIVYMNTDLANLQFPMACMYNAISEFDYNRIESDVKNEAKVRTIRMQYAALVIYQFAFFESFIHWKKWKVAENEYSTERLIAYRHIRHTFAHSFDGKRVRREGTARDIECEKFDIVMQSDTPLLGVTVDKNDCVSIDYDSVLELNTLLRSVATLHIIHTKQRLYDMIPKSS